MEKLLGTLGELNISPEVLQKIEKESLEGDVLRIIIQNPEFLKELAPGVFDQARLKAFIWGRKRPRDEEEEKMDEAAGQLLRLGNNEDITRKVNLIIPPKVSLGAAKKFLMMDSEKRRPGRPPGSGKPKKHPVFMITNGGEAKFSCKKCAKSFKSRYGLVYHQRNLVCGQEGLEEKLPEEEIKEN